MKKKIGEILVQIIPVMIGVYLGFVLSNWSETNKRKSQTELLRKNIITEIKSNKSKISEVLNYHIMLRDSSRIIQNSDNIEMKTLPPFFKGTRTAILGNGTFDTGVQTGLINNLKFQEIQEINEIYTMQSAYKDFNQLILSNMMMKIDFKEDNNGDRKFYGFLAVTMTDIVLQEKRLIQNYEKLLEEIDTE